MPNNVQVRTENVLDVWTALAPAQRANLIDRHPDLAHNIQTAAAATVANPEQSISYATIALIMSAWTTIPQAARVRLGISHKQLTVALDDLILDY